MSEQKKNDGGPVFPQTNDQRYSDPIHGVIRPSDIYGDAPAGLSMRDYFAAEAMSDMCGTGGADGPGGLWLKDQDAPEIARRAYVMADAMIAERSK